MAEGAPADERRLSASAPVVIRATFLSIQSTQAVLASEVLGMSGFGGMVESVQPGPGASGSNGGRSEQSYQSESD